MDLTEKTGNLSRHPWELSRVYNLLKILKKSANSVFADIGAGDGYFSSKLTAVTDKPVFAIDNQFQQANRSENGIIFLDDVSALENSSVDCVLLMDVLEHVEHEHSFLELVLDKLKANGKILITVPAWQFLFSSHDSFLKHYRRYSRQQMISVLKRHNIEIEQNYYFFISLFLLRCFSKLIEKLGKKERKNRGVGQWGYDERSIVTRTLLLMLNIDFMISKTIGKHLRLPGLSFLAVCRKKG
ncbi:methyltransferase [Chitinispirillum alkaliphilum]|nr:methyltransferase [Chitinispirillum alkaliphilum]